FWEGKMTPRRGYPPPPPRGGQKTGLFGPPHQRLPPHPPRRAPHTPPPGPPRGGSGPSSIDPPLPTPPGPGGVHCLSPYFRGKEGERWGRGVFQHIQTDAFTTPVHCIDRIAYEGVWTKHSGGDGLEVTHLPGWVT